MLKSLGWSNFTKLVDSAVEAGIIDQMERDDGVEWLALRASADRDEEPMDQGRVASTSTMVSDLHILKPYLLTASFILGVLACVSREIVIEFPSTDGHRNYRHSRFISYKV